jgi:hypothetical protein
VVRSGIEVAGGGRDAASPVVHVRVAGQPSAAPEAEALLQRVVDSALKRSAVLFTLHQTSQLDRVRPPPSIRWRPPLHAHPRCRFMGGQTPSRNGHRSLVMRRGWLVKQRTWPCSFQSLSAAA